MLFVDVDKVVTNTAARAAGCAVVDLQYKDTKIFQGYEHDLWLARVEDGREFWVFLVPITTAYPKSRYRSAEEVFSYHLGRSLREFDRDGRLTVVCTFAPNTE